MSALNNIELKYITLSAKKGKCITLEVASTCIIAILRFKRKLASTGTHIIDIHFSRNRSPLDSYNAIPPVDKTELLCFNFCDFDNPHLVQELQCITQARDVNKLRELGGIEGIASLLHTDMSAGLVSNTIDFYARKKVFGENVYPKKKARSFTEFLWEACKDITLVILMVCACLSLGFGIKSEGLKEGWYDGTSIAFAVILVVLVTAISNFKQSKQFQKLAQARADITVRVLRDNTKCNIPVEDIVVGDIVELQTGDQLSADGLLLSGHSLAIDESSFTGESEYFYPHPQQNPFLRAGSTVQDGCGFMLVTAVGTKTEWGYMMAILCTNESPTEEQTPLQARLTKAAVQIGYIGLSIAFLVLVILSFFYFMGKSNSGNLTRFRSGHTTSTEIMNALVHIFSIVVTIIVVAVPEGLPLAVTLTLAYSMRKMMADNALVRKLSACETMGSATIICTDKTGTLTTNQMTVVKAWVADCTQQSLDHDQQQMIDVVKSLPTEIHTLLFQSIAQNTMACVSDFTTQEKHNSIVGCPTEKAILSWGLKCGMNFKQEQEKSDVLQVEPFNSTKKLAAVILRTQAGKIIVHWKGAAEIILSMCDRFLCLNDNNVNEKMMSACDMLRLETLIGSMSTSGLRCLAFAYCDITAKFNASTADSVPYTLPESGLTLLALVGIKDPCRPGVNTAVKTVMAAGVKVVMVTGDHLKTAQSIAYECGILNGTNDNTQTVVEGSTFRNWEENERKVKLPSIAVITRALPSDKLLLVETLKSMGEIIAVTGDGTNDAPALHSAHIGLSMGIEGTVVAKENSDIIILDDNFTSVVNVVRWGRSIYLNIQKFLQFQLTVNVAALTIDFIAAVTTGDVPLTAVQLLWVNLIMDTLGALALATEAPSDDLLTQPPVRQNEPLITKVMWKNILFQAAYQVIVLLTLQFKGVNILNLSRFSNANDINRTVIFNAFVLSQFFNEVNARQPYRLNIFHRLLRNRTFIVIVMSTLILQVVMVEFLGKFAGTVHLDWQQWLVCFSLASLSWPIGLIAKTFRFGLFSKPLSLHIR